MINSPALLSVAAPLRAEILSLSIVPLEAHLVQTPLFVSKAVLYTNTSFCSQVDGLPILQDDNSSALPNLDPTKVPPYVLTVDTAMDLLAGLITSQAHPDRQFILVPTMNVSWTDTLDPSALLGSLVITHDVMVMANAQDNVTIFCGRTIGGMKIVPPARFTLQHVALVNLSFTPPPAGRPATNYSNLALPLWAVEADRKQPYPSIVLDAVQMVLPGQEWDYVQRAAGGRTDYLLHPFEGDVGMIFRGVGRLLVYTLDYQLSGGVGRRGGCWVEMYDGCSCGLQTRNVGQGVGCGDGFGGSLNLSECMHCAA